MSESEYWIKVIEWLSKNKMIFAFHNSHKSELMKDHEEWVIEFESTTGELIPVHSIKIKNSYSDFLVLKSEEFEDIDYIYSLEVKGKIDRSGFIRGIYQAEDAQNGTDYSAILIPKDYVKPEYELELNKKGIVLGEIDNKGNINLLNKYAAKSSFNPKTHNRILKFLLIIKQKKKGELISKIRSNKTIFIHYLIPGYIKYLYRKYENKDLTSNELEDCLKTHWRKLIIRKEWDKFFSQKVDHSKILFEEWDKNNIKDFIKVSNHFGFMNKNLFLFSFIEFYLKSIKLPNVDIFPEVQNQQIKNNIIGLFSCAVDMIGRNNWLFQKHPLLSHLILDFLSKRTDMKIFNKWIRNVIEMVQTSKKEDVIYKIGVSFRDIINLISKVDFLLVKEFFLKENIGKRASKDDICISPIGNLKCPKSGNEKCYGQTIKAFNQLLNYNQEISSLLLNPNNPIETYMDLPKKYFEENNKTMPLRFGFIKAIADLQILYNFKRNLINLGYFPKEFVENNELLKENNYPLGNDTRLGKYCPYLDRWSMDIESDIFNQ